MKKKMAAVLAICILASGSAFAARMVCEKCIVLTNGDITCYNCTIG